MPIIIRSWSAGVMTIGGIIGNIQCTTLHSGYDTSCTLYDEYVRTSHSHWNSVLWLADPPTKDRPSNHTWKPPCRTLQCEHALRQEVVGRSKFAKVTLETVRRGVLGVFIPPICGGPVLTEVWEMMSASCACMRNRERETCQWMKNHWKRPCTLKSQTIIFIYSQHMVK